MKLNKRDKVIKEFNELLRKLEGFEYYVEGEKVYVEGGKLYYYWDEQKYLYLTDMYNTEDIEKKIKELKFQKGLLI